MLRNEFCPAGQHVRALFLSDVHLGYRCTQAEKLLQLLHSVRPEKLYLVGDFIDGWRLRRRWHWQPIYMQILQRLLELEARGTELFYTPGNHDEFFRTILKEHSGTLGLVQVAEEFHYQTANGETWLVLHGDQFEHELEQASWLKSVGGNAYDALVALDHHFNRVLRWFEFDEYRFSSKVKQRIGRALRFIQAYEERLIEHAAWRGCQGVICGHIHMPRLDTSRKVRYANTGDWVEHCTALAERTDGVWQLLSYADPVAPRVLTLFAPVNRLESQQSELVGAFHKQGAADPHGMIARAAKDPLVI
jgi:UDP-2,3-diacylglucosamine pyrophosphatase LpxH